jgi:hypothetical protein
MLHVQDISGQRSEKTIISLYRRRLPQNIDNAFVSPFWVLVLLSIIVPTKERERTISQFRIEKRSNDIHKLETIVNCLDEHMLLIISKGAEVRAER